MSRPPLRINKRLETTPDVFSAETTLPSSDFHHRPLRPAAIGRETDRAGEA